MQKSDRKRRILISVTDKGGLDQFKALIDTGEWEIISTGGTATKLEELGIPCLLVENVTGFPEMMNGRLKTLHPKVMGGILADRSKIDHLQKALEHGIELIDIVVVNLYAFDKEPGVERIDVGGPSMVRAAAKNFADVTVVVDPKDYPEVIKEVLTEGITTLETREELAMKAFQHTAAYDHMIHKWMVDRLAKRGPHFFGPIG